MDLRRIIGGNVRAFRRRRGLSQEALAFEIGLDQAYVSRIESGACNSTALVIARLAIALDVPPDHLLKAPGE